MSATTVQVGDESCNNDYSCLNMQGIHVMCSSRGEFRYTCILNRLVFHFASGTVSLDRFTCNGVYACSNINGKIFLHV